MSFDITSTVTELKSINAEVKRMCEELTKLRKRKKELETVLAKFLEDKNQPGFKYKGMAIIAEEKNRQVVKKKEERLKDAVDILRMNGVQNPDRVYNELMKSQKKEEVKKQVQIKDL
jgi:hypothetical protein